MLVIIGVTLLKWNDPEKWVAERAQPALQPIFRGTLP